MIGQYNEYGVMDALPGGTWPQVKERQHHGMLGEL